MNTDRRAVIIRTLRGLASNDRGHMSPHMVNEILEMLEAPAPFGVPNLRQREAMIEVLSVYLHAPTAARLALDAMLEAANRNKSPAESFTSGFRTTGYDEPTGFGALDPETRNFVGTVF